MYRWSDEVGKTIATYGYGVTGNAADLSRVRDCYDVIDDDVDGKFRHGQNVVTAVSQGTLEP